MYLGEHNKDFSKSERIEYARRLEKIEALRAKERMAVNAKDGTQNFAEVKKGETAQIVAEKFGIGNKETYRQEKYIVDNADSLTPEDNS